MINLSEYKGARLVALENMKGHSDTLFVSRLKLASFDLEEEIIFVGTDNKTGEIDSNILKIFFECIGRFDESYHISTEEENTLKEKLNKIIYDKIDVAKLRNVEFVREEEFKLTHWTEDKIIGLENELDNVKKQVREAQK